MNIDNIPLGKGITGAAATSNEIIRVHDTAADPRYIASHPDIRSEIAVPLMVQHRVIGVMDLESERIGYFTDDHARTLSLLAPSVAISVENARLYQEIGERERRMQEDLRAAFELQTILLPQGRPLCRDSTLPLDCGRRARSAAISMTSSSTRCARGNRVRRFERKGRGGRALRRHGKRVNAHIHAAAGAAPRNR